MVKRKLTWGSPRVPWGAWSCRFFWSRLFSLFFGAPVGLWSASLLFLRTSDLCTCASSFLSSFKCVWSLYNIMLVSAGRKKQLYVYMCPPPLGSPSLKSFLAIKNKDLMHDDILCWKRKNAFCWGWYWGLPTLVDHGKLLSTTNI